MLVRFTLIRYGAGGAQAAYFVLAVAHPARTALTRTLMGTTSCRRVHHRDTS
jgi:hypothetical protein